MRRLFMLLGVVALTMLALASSALARQRADSVASARAGLVSRMLVRERADGPAWVLRNLTRSRDHGSFGHHGVGGGGGGGDHSRIFWCDGT